jgi:hypothetical protein
VRERAQLGADGLVLCDRHGEPRAGSQYTLYSLCTVLVIKAELVSGGKGAEDGVIQPVAQKKVRCWLLPWATSNLHQLTLYWVAGVADFASAPGPG